MEEIILKNILKDNLSFYSYNGNKIYQISFRKKYYEFICDDDYPETIPQIISESLKNDEKKMKNIIAKANEFKGTPMIYDLLLLCIKEEELDLNTDVQFSLTIDYDVDLNEKITEEEFLEWKSRNNKSKELKEGITGKALFLKSNIKKYILE